MPSRDLRSWIAQLEAEGELKRIKTKVDWDGEISQIIKKIYMKQGPALLFENIKDHEATLSKKLFTNALGTKARWNIILGLPKDTPVSDTIRTIRDRIKKPVAPVRVKSGPVKDNIVKGKDVDLFQFPVPKWHPLDNGRYINTFCGAVTRDPDTGENNVGIYRGGILGKNKIGVLLIPMKDWGILYCKYQKMGKPMPVAFVYGWDPSLLAVSGAPYRGNEYELAGAIRKEPVELVKCEMSDIEVPASAEIVVEGTISPDPDTYETEGPFGEGSGYYGESRKRPVVTVNCITHQKDPIFRGSLVGTRIPDELHTLGSVSISAAAWDVLESQGIPGIVDVAVGFPIRVKIHKMYQGQARQIAAALWGSKFAGQIYNVTVVVEDDVDIHDYRAVWHAVHFKADFNHDAIVYPLYIGSPVDPSIPYEMRDELTYGAGVQNKVLIDATTDWYVFPKRAEWKDSRSLPLCSNQKPEIEKLVEKRWKEYDL